MVTFELVLMLLLAVLISAVLDQIVPRVSLPLIQIALGVVFALLSVTPIEITLDPEFFLLVFIAPLLFIDAKEANKKDLVANLPSIMSFAIGLVIVITLVVGYALNALVPSVGLATAFALGAALGPTDAVAVTSLSKEAHLARREQNILKGECLLNDASGVVAFQFALAAALSGAFSLVNATGSFLILFFGGIAAGFVFAAVFLWLAARVRNLGVDNITFHVLLEISMPFIVYLACEVLGVSGIIGVVTCGIVWSMYKDRKVSPYQSRLNISLASVWGTLSFALNGTVFVLLGTQLPAAFMYEWGDSGISNYTLVGLVLLLTLLIVVLRFAWALAMQLVTTNPANGRRDTLNWRTVRNALITTAGGPKGAVTLSIIMSIPLYALDGSAFPNRYLLIFLASGVILCTLLIANFALPILAPAPDEEEEAEKVEQFYLVRIEILRTVIEKLMGESTDDNEQETRTVIRSYSDRIARIRDIGDIEPPSVKQLRIKVIDRQAEVLLSKVDAGELDAYTTFRMLRSLMKQKDLIADEKSSILRLRRTSLVVAESIRSWWRNLISFIHDEPTDDYDLDESMREVRITSEQAAIDYLYSLVNHPDYPAEQVAKLLIAHERGLAMLAPEEQDNPTPLLSLSQSRLAAVRRRGFQLELDCIQDFYSADELSRAQARTLLNSVNLMMLDEEYL